MPSIDRTAPKICTGFNFSCQITRPKIIPKTIYKGLKIAVNDDCGAPREYALIITKLPKLIKIPIPIVSGIYLPLSVSDLFGEKRIWIRNMTAAPISETYALTRKIEIFLGKNFESV